MVSMDGHEGDREPFDPIGRHLPDPYPYLATARAERPVFYSPAVGGWCISRYDDVAAVVDDTDTFSSADAFPRPRNLPSELDEWVQWFYEDAPPLTFLDPPTHTRVRRVINKGFTPRAMAAFEPDVREITERFVRGVADRPEFDLVADLAAPLPLSVIMRITGVPDADTDRFRRWFNQSFILVAASHAADAATLLECGEGQREWRAYVTKMIHEREAAPRDDLISFIVQRGVRDQRLTHDEIMTQIITVFAAGTETTANALINIVYGLLRRPEQWSAIVTGQADLDLIIDEGLRLNTSVFGLYRTARRDAVVGGVTIPARDMVFLLWGSANRDETKYQDPLEFRPGRARRMQDLTFGRGIHYCIGAPLARMQLRIALQMLAEHIPGLHLAVGDPPRYRPIPQFRALESLLVRA
jgi:cytochrome P450